MEEISAKSPSRGINFSYGLVVLLAVLLPVSLVIAFGYYRSEKQTVTGGVNEEKPVAKSAGYINCDDVRDTVSLGGVQYFGCMGGVLGIDKNGKVVSQFDMPGGLPSFTVTGIEVWKDKLVVSTQNGIAIIDPKTKKTKKVSVDEGLNEGANSVVAIDGDIAWVGTFDGFARVDLNTYEVTNYLADQFGLGSSLNVPEIVVAENNVYLINVASIYSGGGIIKYSKKSKDFEIYKPSVFGQKNRVDLFGMVSVDKYVVTSDLRDLFVFDDSMVGNPKKIDSGLFDEFVGKGKYRLVRIVGQNNNEVVMYLSGDDNKSYFVGYDPVTNKVRKMMDLIGTGLGLPFAIRDGVMWLDDDKGFVKNIDLKTGTMVSVGLKDRPVAFREFGAMINGLVYMLADSAIWSYDPSGGFVKNTNLFDGNNNYIDGVGFAFQPIEGTDRIVIFRQVCGMGCEKPEMWVVNYPGFEITKVQFSDKVMASQGVGMSDYGYYLLRFGGVSGGKVIINPDRSNPSKDRWIFDPISLTWMSEKMSDQPEDNKKTASCFEKYNFVDGKFVKMECNAADGSKYSILIEKQLASLTEQNGEMMTSNALPAMWPAYKPKSFEPFGWEIGDMKFDQRYVYIPTSKGLAVFDRQNKTFGAYGPKDGILANQVDKVLADENNMYLISNWGGFNVILR